MSATESKKRKYDSSNRAKKVITYDAGFRLADGFYASFILFNPTTQKNERFQINPAVATLKEALVSRHKAELRFGIAQAKAKKRFEFLQKFHEQEKLFNAYTKHRQKAAKKSWPEDVSRMKCYVFPFFIGKLNLNHPAFWFEHWQEFQDSLGTPIRNNTKTKVLAVNTKDNIIRAANSFIAFAELSEGGSPIKRIPEFKYEEKGRRGVSSVYSQTEIDKLLKAFVERKQPKYAFLLKLLVNTGMRVSEGIGILSTDIVIGSTPAQEKWIFNALKEKTDLFGYILLKSQPLDSNHLVINGEVKRVPLKKRNRIAPEYNRIIPLMDLELTKEIQKFKKVCTDTGLLFEGCSYRELYKIFTEVKASLRFPVERDIHSLRHTFATRFTKLCDGDPRIAEKVLGHSDPRMTARYNHLANELEQMSVADVEDIRAIKII